jgi:hypothetical protein
MERSEHPTDPGQESNGGLDPGTGTGELETSGSDQANDTPTEDQLKELCELLGLKSSKRYQILVAKLVKRVGMDPKKLAVALKRATIDS